MSNTKLTVEQKQALKTLRELYPDVEIFHFPDSRVCVGIQRTGEKMGEFSVAICAETETKYRKKVGELLVRERLELGQCLPVELGSNYCYCTDEEFMESIAQDIAQAVAG